MDSTPARRSISLASPAILLGFFLLLCSAIALIASAADAWTLSTRTRWPLVTAVVVSSELDSYRAATRQGGGKWYFAECRASYDLNGQPVVAAFRSSAVRSGEMAPLESWLAAHPPRSRIDVRINPAREGDAVPADPAGLPMPQHPGQDLLLAAVAAAAGVALIVAGRLRGSRQ